MGIQGLMTFILKNQDACADKVDLLEVAADRGGIELLVDFYSFEHFLLRKFWNALSLVKNNQYLRICGGEYGSLNTYLVKLVSDLKSLDISLVFYIDAAKGSSTEDTRQKLDTWIYRHHNDVQKLNEIMDVCRAQCAISDLPETTSVRPVLLEIQVIHTLRKCGCEIVQSTGAEADYLLAKDLVEREKAYAAISNDSDFCIFKNCKFIPNDLFDIHDDLQLNQAREVPDKPLRLVAGVVSTEKVMNALQFDSHNLMVELSIVTGNDFTGPFVKNNIQKRLDIHGRRGVETFADWVRRYKTVENHGVISGEMRHNQHFARAVHHSRQFYNLTLPAAQPVHKGFLSQHIQERIQQGSLPSNIMSMHNNFYWHRMLLEDTSYGQPCAEVALAELRAYIYRLVLPRQESMVNEYGRSPWEALRTAGVIAVDDTTVPPINFIRDGQWFKNLRNFHYIISHIEPESEVWFDRYGRKNGFIIYLLRYFLLLNWGRNLNISEDEFLSLLALALGKPKESEYQQMALRPTPRCVTIGNWFQDLYRHAYSFLGKLLYITPEFPLPEELFSGSAWTAFYTCCKDETFYVGVNQVSLEVLQRTQQHMNRIIKEKRHMIRNIVAGVFYFDDRW